MAIFFLPAVYGFKNNYWWLVSGFAAHGVWDYFHDALVYSTGTPLWWSEFCLGYDVFIAFYLYLSGVKKDIKA